MFCNKFSVLVMIYEIFINFVLLSVALAHYPYHHPEQQANMYPEYSDYDQSLSSGESDQGLDPERMTFDGIYERRKKFDVETPMEFPTESHPESEHLNDDGEPQPDYHPPHSHDSDSDHHSSHSYEPNPDYSMYSSDDNNSPPPPSDDYASESQSETNPKSLLSDGCLRCLCEASSDCDPQVRCHVEGPTDYNCGPFQVDMNYWNDAGSPGADQNDPMDFEECVGDIECAIETVNGYMQKHAKDCDGDGKVSCDDYAKIHKAGEHQCNSSWILSTPYWNKYKDCFFEYR